MISFGEMKTLMKPLAAIFPMVDITPEMTAAWKNILGHRPYPDIENAIRAYLSEPIEKFPTPGAINSRVVERPKYDNNTSVRDVWDQHIKEGLVLCRATEVMGALVYRWMRPQEAGPRLGTVQKEGKFYDLYEMK